MSGWKTLIFNGVLAAFAALAEILAYLDAFDWRAVLPPQQAGLALLAVGIANILLRHATDSPAGWRRKR